MCKSIRGFVFASANCALRVFMLEVLKALRLIRRDREDVSALRLVEKPNKASIKGRRYVGLYLVQPKLPEPPLLRRTLAEAKKVSSRLAKPNPRLLKWEAAKKLASVLNAFNPKQKRKPVSFLFVRLKISNLLSRLTTRSRFLRRSSFRRSGRCFRCRNFHAAT